MITIIKTKLTINILSQNIKNNVNEQNKCFNKSQSKITDFIKIYDYPPLETKNTLTKRINFFNKKFWLTIIIEVIINVLCGFLI